MTNKLDFSFYLKQGIFSLALLLAFSLVLAGCSCSKKTDTSGQKQVNKNVNAEEQEFNMDLAVPQQVSGNLNNVPKEEIDTLFNNIK